MDIEIPESRFFVKPHNDGVLLEIITNGETLVATRFYRDEAFTLAKKIIIACELPELLGNERFQEVIRRV